MYFLEKIGQIIVWCPFWGWRPCLRNPRSATAVEHPLWRNLIWIKLDKCICTGLLSPSKLCRTFSQISKHKHSMTNLTTIIFLLMYYSSFRSSCFEAIQWQVFVQWLLTKLGTTKNMALFCFQSAVASVHCDLRFDLAQFVPEAYCFSFRILRVI